MKEKEYKSFFKTGPQCIHRLKLCSLCHMKRKGFKKKEFKPIQIEEDKETENSSALN